MGQNPHSSWPMRPVDVRTSGASMLRRDDGAIMLRGIEPLEEYPRVLTERLVYWAQRAPDRPFAAQRGADGKWRSVTYAKTLAKVRSLGQALLDRGLSEHRPVTILSGNDLDHLMLMLAGLYVGVPTASIAPAYSLVSTDFAKLKHVMKVLTPGLVFVSKGREFSRAIDAVLPRDIEITVADGPLPDRNSIGFDDLSATTPTPAVEAAHSSIDPDGIAKFLFSSGSTGTPKAVINTHRMICSNQQMILQAFRFMAAEPPVILDWCPWNHTAGGNHNTGMALYNGGTFYIDDGRPTASGIVTTVENLREVAPTIYFNVPKGYEELLAYLRRDRELRDNFFSRLKLIFYAAASMSLPIWEAYRNLAVDSCGERILMVTGLGATETAPMAVQCTWDSARPGLIGIPVPGVEVKLAPVGAKLEIRIKGPSITPGYWKAPELTRAAFDEEGYYKFGDAVQLVDPNDGNQGLLFDGRLAEDFKLDSGTWVSVGPLRSRILNWFAPYARDVVITGHDRGFLGMLVVPDLDPCRALVPELPSTAEAGELLRREPVAGRFAELLESFAGQATGASNRIVRAILLEDPPSLDAGEITDKGSLNQRMILDRRRALVEEIYAEDPPPHVICIRK